MALYFLLCAISVLAGCAVLTFIGVKVDGPALFLAPVVTISSLAILMGALVLGGFTVGEITPCLYTFFSGLAIAGCVLQRRVVTTGWRSHLILMGLPLAVFLPFFLEGIENYSGGLCMDGWAYVTVGQSLQHYPLGAEGWLPPFVQFASQFGKTRFITFASLALLAPLSGQHNDTQNVFGSYVAWLFFVYGGACLFFAKAARLTPRLAWMFVLMALLSGWTLKLMNANSVDNTLALCFLPAVFGILLLNDSPSVRQGLLLGVVVAAGMYAYPESSPFTLFALVTMAAQRVIAMRHLLREFGEMAVAFLVALGACILPYALQMWAFYKDQVANGTRAPGSRPGEGFYLLLSTARYVLPGFWGLTPDFAGQHYPGHFDKYAMVAGYMLTLLALAGMFVLVRRRCWSLPLFVLVMSAGYAFCLIRLKYPYAAYKVLVLAWFAVVYMVVVAVAWLSETARQRSTALRFAVNGLACVLVATVGAFFLLQQRSFYNSLPFKSLAEFRKISALEQLVGDRPLAFIVKETYANIWGAYFLRNTKLFLAGEYRGYMSKRVMDRSAPVNLAKVRYVVTNTEGSFAAPHLFSREGPYYIWDCGGNPWALVTEVHTTLGPVASSSESASSFTIGKVYTELEILSSGTLNAIIGANFTLDSGTKDAEQLVRLATMTGFKQDFLISNGFHSFQMPLQAGLNRIVIRSADKQSLPIHVEHLAVSAPEASEGSQSLRVTGGN